MKEKLILSATNLLSNITIEKGVAFVFLVIVFSWEFHFLWLLYDLVALLAVYFFSKHINAVLGSALFLVLSVFIILTIFSGFHIISILSIWDNIKHVFILFMLLFLVERHLEGRILRFTNGFGFIIGGIFIIQLVLVFYQYFTGFYRDDISGTFGAASGHSIAYYCLLYLSYLFYIIFSIIFLTGYLISFITHGFCLSFIIQKIFNLLF